MFCYSEAHAFQQEDRLKPEKTWSVTFRGNKTFNNVVLDQVVAAEQPSFFWKVKFWSKSGYDFSELEVRKDVIRLERFYQRRGFGNAEVTYTITEKKKEWKKNITFFITEGPPVIIQDREITIHADSKLEKMLRSDARIRRLMSGGLFQPGRRYQSVREPEVVGSFIRRLRNMGFAHADVKLDAEVDSIQQTASVKIDIYPGPLVYFDEFEVTGTQLTSKNYVLKEGALEMGELFSSKKIETAQEEIFNHHLFRFATINIPDQEPDSTLTIQINVREHKPRSVRLRAGVSIEEILRGEAAWIHRNAFGRAHRFSANARATFINQRGNLNYQFPQIFNTRSSIIINPFGEHLIEPGFELVSGGISNSFVYKSSNTATSSFSYEFTRNREVLEQSIENLPDSVESFNISTFQISGIYGQGVLNRQSGWLIQPSLELSGLIGSASFSFQKITADVRRYIPISSFTTLALRGRGGFIFSAENDSLPTNLRFFNGGTNSVRGFGRQQLGPKRLQLKENGEFDEFVPMGGRASLTFNIELRQDWNELLDGFGLAFFLDGGQVWENIDNGLGRPVQYSAGGGFRYNSPIGPVRFDVGYILNPTDEDLNIFDGQDFGGAADRIGFHFSIGQSF